MKCNVGNIDRAIRIVVGLALIGLAVTNTIGEWGWVGIISLLTGVFRYCPAYSMFGCKSCNKDKSCCK
jgi:hypothetical protein